MIDFHTHILPGMDDGSRSLEQSVAMLREAKSQGVEWIVATPHFYPEDESVESFLERREKAEAALRKEMAKHEDLPQVVVGAEVYYFTGISDSDILQKLTIGDSRYVMVEPPLSPWPERVFRELEGIVLQQGLIPIVAHIDRYVRPFRTYKIPERLSAMPLLVQASGEFFLDKRTKNMALRMLRKGQIHLLGSDAHNMEERCPNLGQAAEVIRKKLGEDLLEEISQSSRELLRKSM